MWDKYFNSISKEHLLDSIKKQQKDLYFELTKSESDVLPSNFQNPVYIILEGLSNVNLQTVDFNLIWDYLVNSSELKQFTESLFYRINEKSVDIINIYPGFFLSEDTNQHGMRIFFRFYTIANKDDFVLQFKKYSNYFTFLNKHYDEFVKEFLIRKKKDTCAKKIQQGCHNWLWKPICNDGSLGINAKLGWYKVNQILNQI